MDKRLIFPGNGEDKRDVFFVKEDRNYLVKRAAEYHPEISKYIQDAKPMKGLIQALITALGAFEFWGQNVNGDRFRIPALSHKGSDYGYETFKTNANYFNHHVNQDPALAKGKVLHAVWNDKSKRVELIIGIDPGRDPEAASQIDRGESLCFSMGCKVPYDICTVCANRAKTRAQYCDHLKYMMGQIDPISNQLIGADNTYPKFFDISRVLIPADKTAYMWTKIASAENPFHGVPSAFIAESAGSDDLMKKVAQYREEHPVKKASIGKRAVIKKRIEFSAKPKLISKLDESVPPAKALLQEAGSTLSKESLNKISELPLDKILSTFAGLGITPKPAEFQRIVIRCVLKKPELADELDAKGHVFDPHGSQATEGVPEVRICANNFHPGLAQALAPLMSERSFYRPHLTRRIIIIAKKLEDKDPEIVKKAEEIRTLMRAKPAPERINPTTVAGILAALYALVGPHSTGAAKGIGGLIANHPFLALSLGAGALKAFQSLKGPATYGHYSLDDPTRGFYNRDWQSRFARMQARPVTVIKTGSSKADTLLAKKVLFGVPAIFLGSEALKYKKALHPEKESGPASRMLERHPDLLSGGLILEHATGKPISKHVEKLVRSGRRVFSKAASIRNIEFIESVPELDSDLISDIAILDASSRISIKILGG